MLSCYTLSDTLKKGIDISRFESIVMETPDTTDLLAATIISVPCVFHPNSDNKATTAEVLSHALSFIKQDMHGENMEEGGYLFAVDTNCWNVFGANKDIALIDPSGADNYVLVFLESTPGIKFTSASGNLKALYIDEQKQPIIRQAVMGNLLLSAVTRGQELALVDLVLAQEAISKQKACARKARK